MKRENAGNSGWETVPAAAGELGGGRGTGLDGGSSARSHHVPIKRHALYHKQDRQDPCCPVQTPAGKLIRERDNKQGINK